MVDEAVHAQVRPLWTVISRGRDYMCLATRYDEYLCVYYSSADAISHAIYRHWDRDSGDTVCREEIAGDKRVRVLHLIGAVNCDETLGVDVNG
jgi:hypothetical protein